jgi:hypothetical protein
MTYQANVFAPANVFALQPEPGGPHLAHWGWGPRVRPVRAHSSYATESASSPQRPLILFQYFQILVMNFTNISSNMKYCTISLTLTASGRTRRLIYNFTRFPTFQIAGFVLHFQTIFMR